MNTYRLSSCLVSRAIIARDAGGVKGFVLLVVVGVLFLVGGEPLFDKALGTAGLALTGAGFFVPIREPVCVECIVAYACAT